MALLVPNVGEEEFLTRMMKVEGGKLKLYTSNTTWGETSTVGSATECSTGGYAQISLTTAWTVTVPAGGTTYAAYAEQTFTFTSACTAYGYMVCNSAATIVLFAEAFTDGPYAIPSGGGTIKVTPRIEAN
jgi:hypothetical protein